MDTPLTRRRALAAGLGALGSAVAGCLSAPDVTADRTDAEPTASPQTATTSAPSKSLTASETTATATLPDAVGVETVATELTAPVGIEFLPDGTGVVPDQAGTIHAVTDSGRRPKPILDVRDRMVDLSGYEERGLLGVAVHPAYPDDRRLFVRYSAPPGAETPDGYSHTFVLSSFELDPDELVADPDSERTILDIAEPQGNHNAGAIAFGPEGYLYVGVGDGGGAHDTGIGHVDDWYAANAGGNGQDVTENLLGSILRIDVTDTGNDPYTIPDSNPLVGRAGNDEHYAWGFRNPWRFSFHEGELYAADVGQNRFEEIDHVRKGGNYGWNVREGAHCFSPESPNDPPEDCPSETADGERLIRPVIEYAHSGEPIGGVAVIGGYFYDGAAIPGLRGRYVFADWQAGGTLYVGTPTDEKPWRTAVLSVDDDAFGRMVLGFGRDPASEVYVCTTDSASVSGSTGAIFRLTPA